MHDEWSELLLFLCAGRTVTPVHSQRSSDGSGHVRNDEAIVLTSAPQRRLQRCCRQS
jgi:hypothetical protein